EVGCGQAEAAIDRLQPHVGQDRNSVAAFDHALHMIQGLEEGCTLDGQLHILISSLFGPVLVCTQDIRYSPTTTAKTGVLPDFSKLFGAVSPYPSRMRRRWTRSSSSAPSAWANSSILLTACMTVVWSRPPNLRPISGSEREVSCLARYMA